MVSGLKLVSINLLIKMMYKVIVNGKKVTVKKPGPVVWGGWIEPSKEDCELIDKWMDIHAAGKRMAWDTWILKNDKFVTLFLLHWS